MRRITTLQDQIIRHEKIELSGHISTKVAFTFLFLFIGTGITTAYFIFADQGISGAFLATTLLFTLGVGLITHTICKTMATAYIKGELLVVRYISGTAKITGLHGIKTTKSVYILGVRFTLLQFKLDGRAHRVLIFGFPNHIEDPKIIIDTIRSVA